jgi:hypothetical protein
MGKGARRAEATRQAKAEAKSSDNMQKPEDKVDRMKIPEMSKAENPDFYKLRAGDQLTYVDPTQPLFKSTLEIIVPLYLVSIKVTNFSLKGSLPFAISALVI